MDGLPVFNTVAKPSGDRGQCFHDFRSSSSAADAIMERPMGIELIACITRGFRSSTWWCKGYLAGRNCRLLGPNCPGVITREVQNRHHARLHP